MKIRTTASEINEVTYWTQAEDTLSWIREPIVSIHHFDPIWEELDSELVVGNTASRIDRGNLTYYIYQVRPGLTVAWVANFRSASAPTDVQSILINEDDLARLRECGLTGWNWGKFVEWLKQ